MRAILMFTFLLSAWGCSDDIPRAALQPPRPATTTTDCEHGHRAAALSATGRAYVAARVGFHEPDTYLMETAGGTALEGPVDAPWVHIPYGKAEFNSPVDAESYTYSNTPGDMVLRLLPGDRYEVDWNIVCADLPDHFDNATVIHWQGGVLTVNDTMRNLSWKVKGAELRANVADAVGVTGMILDPPGPGLYKVAGIER